MLPEYLDLKTELTELFQQFMRQRVAAHSGFIGTLPKARVFEGHKTVIRRSAGDKSTNDFKRLSVAHSVPVAEADEMTFTDVLRHLDEIAAKMAKEMSLLAFKQLDETLEEAGQVTRAEGETMSPAMLLKAMKGIEMSFDADGSHRNLTLVIHPSRSDATAAALRALGEDPEIREKYEALIEQKREEWRAREASRRLVG
jgi:hypothetical protein